jgi:hypothetical protein
MIFMDAPQMVLMELRAAMKWRRDEDDPLGNSSGIAEGTGEDSEPIRYVAVAQEVNRRKPFLRCLNDWIRSLDFARRLAALGMTPERLRTLQITDKSS